MVAVLGISTAHAEESGPVARAKERAQDEFNTGLEVLHGMYRRRMAQLITSATRVEVLLLDFSFGEEKRAKPALQVFEIKPYSKNTPVLASHFCTPKEREELLPVLSNAIGGQPHIGGAACHFPIHGLRVWIGPEIAFETSICWYCSNFIMEYGRGAAWENHTDGFRDLKTLLMRLMPIPEDEVARFKKGHDAGPDGH
ncbi:hypothetical protein [Prosthecobacter sp.]|uniref:hypothetical protein n=1 Tax=Prosthecobacter sp. TaxID=1965333 RepID=UPI002ABBD1F6|nr:hypothetical protein [Prosthecobacter sp.]MDZ4406237.1 hypothetical protein [Prosthecobacter sp.]